ATQSTLRPTLPPRPTPGLTPERLLAELLARSRTPLSSVPPGLAQVREPGPLEQFLFSPEPGEALRARLDHFLALWNARPLPAPAPPLCCEVPLPGGFATRYPGCRPALVCEALFEPGDGPAARTEIELRVRPAGDGDADEQMVRDIGPVVMQSLSTHLGGQ